MKWFKIIMISIGVIVGLYILFIIILLFMSAADSALFGIIWFLVFVLALYIAGKIVIKMRQKENEFKYQVRSAVEDFEPSQRWKTEEGYHGELQGWLKTRFPTSRVETRRGSSRPDISINDIAIEVKGPTTHNDLDSIANKCMKYKHHFKEGFIVILFNVLVSDRTYDEWKSILNNTFPEVIVIRK